MVGGDVLSVELMSRAVANVALRVLKGESPDSIPVREIDANVAQFDWRQLRRWGISEARLPADSLVAFRVPTLWDQYKIQIVAAASLLVLQTLLIAGLLVQGARRRRVETALRKSNLENQDLAGRLITAQEAERARIARDLHDDANQQLTGMSIVLGGVRRRLSEDGDSGEVDETLAMLQQRADTLSDSLRNLSHELHSGSLQYVGLVAALEEHCAEFARHHQIDVRVQASDGIGSLQPDIALCLYRVVQEALNNTSRHAHAGAVQIRVARTAEGVELEVIGFEPDRRNGTGLGLRSIGERVRFAKGQVTVDSRPGHGTKLFVQIPVADVANAELASS
jgi:signal transduction histidine kinase